MARALTNEQATVVINSYAESYGNQFTQTPFYAAELRKILTTKPKYGDQKVAESARNFVWDYFHGSAASAMNTRQAFALIGRAKDCSKTLSLIHI